MLNKISSIIFISLIIAGCNREENNERRALSHCADIKFISSLSWSSFDHTIYHTKDQPTITLMIEKIKFFNFSTICIIYLDILQ